MMIRRKLPRFDFWLFFCDGFLLFYPYFMYKTFGKVSFEQLVFHLAHPLRQGDVALMWRFFACLIVLPLVFAALVTYPHALLSKIKSVAFLEKWQNAVKWKTVVGIMAFIASFAINAAVFDVAKWYDDIRHPTALYAENYVLPEKVDFREKKNLILIYLESIENTYQNTDIFPQNALPNLTRLQNENVSFSGQKQLPGTGWTIAGMVGSLCGVPLRIPIRDNKMNYFDRFMPNLTCVSDVMRQNGWDLYYLLGSDAYFSGLDNFAKDHGFDTVWDLKTLKKTGEFSSADKGNRWGASDKRLLEIARDRLGKISAKRPFFFMMSLIDTHFPKYYVDKACPVRFNNALDSVYCTDLLLADFLKWVEKQDFYDDTVIVLLGDHLTMSNNVNEQLNQNKNRSVYNVFINAAANPSEKAKVFSTFDMAPSLLSAVGGVFAGRFGLGVDLFSNEKTLTETLGEEGFSKQLLLFSPEYQRFFDVKD